MKVWMSRECTIFAGVGAAINELRNSESHVVSIFQCYVWICISEKTLDEQNIT
jgi:hypothetical protein